jgi:hypothetical protein
MAHSLIVGMSESGKTTLGKQIAAELNKSGKKVIVLDPMNDPGWKCNYRTSDPDAFLAVFWNTENTGCYAFIDEAGDVVGKYDELMRQTATKGRHWGHSCTYLTQRGALLSFTVRAQCRHLFLFNTPIDDCKQLAKDFNEPRLIEAAQFKQGEYFHVRRFAIGDAAKCTKGVVTWSGSKS